MELSEIFVSRQGEGSNIGKRALFIRLFGCRKNCYFCDTPQGRTGQPPLHSSVESLVVMAHDHRKKDGINLIVITGGEPGEQAGELNDLARELKGRDFTVHLETNGEHKAVSYVLFDHVTVSPKTSNLAWNTIGHSKSVEFKLLHDFDDPDGSISFFQGIVATAKSKYGDYVEICVQPMARGNEDTVTLAEDYKDICSLPAYKDVRILPQLHKMVGIK